MTKDEYLARLERELRRLHVADAADILAEYEQHFAFKLADGYTEEEIAARLGAPAALAAQFSGTPTPASGAGRILTAVALGLADLFAVCFFALLLAWAAVLAAFALCCATAAVCLLTGLNIHGLIPPTPYWCGAVFSVALLALAVLSAVGCVYYSAFVRQLLRAYARFCRNARAAASGGPTLPALSMQPQLPAIPRRRLRAAALVALAVFAASFVLGLLVSMLSAGTLEFWHAWGWFQP